METPRPPATLPVRTALLSILCLWIFYFILTTVRATVLGFHDQISLLERRSAVALIGILLTIGLYILLRPVSRATLGLRIAAVFLASLPFATLFGAINYAAFYVYNPIEMSIDDDPGKRETEDRSAAKVEGLTPAMMIVDGAVTWYFIFVAWSALFLALGYAAEVAAAERRAADARADAQTAELRALRYQVNPHFLFNTLNSLSSLVLTNQADKAERMIMNLANFFRTSLSAEPAEDVELAEEIRLQELYLQIEKVRFPERLQVEFAIPPELRNVCVPGLILQPIVENAIKYGVSRARRPVTIAVSAAAQGERLTLTVADDGDPAAGALAAEGHGVGLVNVRSRLQARFGHAASAEWGPAAPHGFLVRLSMPLVRHDC